jgi:hypothetical protein
VFGLSGQETISAQSAFQQLSRQILDAFFFTHLTQPSYGDNRVRRDPNPRRRISHRSRAFQCGGHEPLAGELFGRAR